MHHDPEPISFNPHHHRQNQTPNCKKRGAENPSDKSEHNFSYINWCSHREKVMETNYHDSSGGENSPSPSHPLLLSENSRAEAIVRGQWELMEMVKNMPDDSYELSLKDLVEHQRAIESPSCRSGAVGSAAVVVHRRAEGKVVRGDEQGRKVDRNLSFENKGMFLNMVFPVSFKGRKKESSVRISGKFERYWWKKKFRGSSDSDTSRTSASSGGSSSGATTNSGGSSDTVRRKRKGLLSSCWPFLQSRSNKSKK